jgi:hypothetical protein
LASSTTSVEGNIQFTIASAATTPNYRVIKRNVTANNC